MTAYTTPITVIAGQLSAPADWNTYVRDDMTHLTEIQNWTPTVVQGVTVTKTVTYGRYWMAGKRVWAECYLAITSSGTAATSVTVSLPVTAATSTNLLIGNGLFYDASATTLTPLYPTITSTAVASFLLSGVSSFLTTQMASGDQLRLALFYEAA